MSVVIDIEKIKKAAQLSADREFAPPEAGDERYLKGRGVTQIRQQEYSKMYCALVVSNGRPVWEWVDKGSERDRTSEAWKAAGGFNK